MIKRQGLNGLKSQKHGVRAEMRATMGLENRPRWLRLLLRKDQNADWILNYTDYMADTYILQRRPKNTRRDLMKKNTDVRLLEREDNGNSRKIRKRVPMAANALPLCKQLI